MPLKHSTETTLVTVLALAIVASGVAVAAMPPLAVSIWPWVAAFVLAVLYPLAVYPMLKSRRADYAFRALHAYPAALLVLWLLLELSSTTATAMHPFQRAYTWGWTAAGVILGLILLLIFCVRVIRQLFRRAFTVGLVAALFLGAAVMGEQAHAPERISVTIASLLRSPQDILDGNLDPSSDPQEESWRMKLRRMARREERLNTRTPEEAQASIHATVSAASAAATRSEPRIAAVAALRDKNRSNVERNDPRIAPVDAPPRLSRTGGEMEAFAMLFVAGYCGVLHQRMRRRMAV
jgi:hypothetical protein